MPVAAEETEWAASGMCEKNDVIDYTNDEEQRRLVCNDLRYIPGAGEPARLDGEMIDGFPDLEPKMSLPDAEPAKKRPRGGGSQPAAAAGNIMDGRMDGNGEKRKRASGGSWRRRARVKRLHTSAEAAGQIKIDSLLLCRTL